MKKIVKLISFIILFSTGTAHSQCDIDLLENFREKLPQDVKILTFGMYDLNANKSFKHSVMLNKEYYYKIYFIASEKFKGDMSFQLLDNGEKIECLKNSLDKVEGDENILEFSPSKTKTFDLFIKNISKEQYCGVYVITVAENLVNTIVPINKERITNNKSDTEKKKKKESSLFYVVEKMPIFNDDGNRGFIKYIQENVTYPKEAVLQGIEGKVFVNMVINEDGSVSNVKVIKSVHPILDEEAMRVVKASPKWTPGSQRGKNVKVVLTFPVGFQLNDNQ